MKPCTLTTLHSGSTVVRLVLQKRRDLLRRGRRLLTMRRRRRTAHNKTTSCVRAPKKKGYYYTCLSHHGYQATHRHHWNTRQDAADANDTRQDAGGHMEAARAVRTTTVTSDAFNLSPSHFCLW